mmetsp:Transcript_47323/g.120772  ORF Transcript_47323/g.120772 Transcript_47323/m.120772 type:complete len:365 (-) Transcript_47323:180-1274(-)|eukprot:jgi/Tetstr1/430284/TSEL_020111.t1
MTASGPAADPAPEFPCPKIHCALLCWSVLPLFIRVDPNVNVIVTASLAVLTGSWRSVKPAAVPLEDRMSKQDALRMPIVGSAVLFSLFIMFTVLPKDLVNTCLSAYFLLLGTFALSASILPFVEPFFPKRLRDMTFEYKLKKLPVIMKEDMDIECTCPELATGVVSACFCIWYCVKKHWLANNLLGLAFSVQGIEHLSLGSVQVGAIMLVGLFVYDIFWVFCTPVMVSVAKSFDAPIKLLFPRGPVDSLQFSMLGLGDIVVPGLFVALMLRYDTQMNKTGTKSSSYFHSVFWGYVAGLLATILVMNIFKAAQPALLYIVPTVLGATFLHAASRGEVKKVFKFEEEHPPEEGADGDTATESKKEE